MKRTTLIAILGLLALALVLASCGGKKPVVEPEAPPPAVEPKDTATPPPPPPPPPPPKQLKESQFQTAYFDFDKSDLRTDAKAALDADYQLLKEFPNAIVQLQGHCDERGTVEYNLSLGERRAKSAQTYLIGLGVDPARLQTISFGEERPADPGHNEAAWAKNRRVEFKVISQ